MLHKQRAAANPAPGTRSGRVCAVLWGMLGLGIAAWTLLSLPPAAGGVPVELYGPLAVIAAFVAGCLLLAWALFREVRCVRLVALIVSIPFSLACAWALVWCVVLMMDKFSAASVAISAVPVAGLYFASATRRISAQARTHCTKENTDGS